MELALLLMDYKHVYVMKDIKELLVDNQPKPLNHNNNKLRIYLMK